MQAATEIEAPHHTTKQRWSTWISGYAEEKGFGESSDSRLPEALRDERQLFV